MPVMGMVLSKEFRAQACTCLVLSFVGFTQGMRTGSLNVREHEYFTTVRFGTVRINPGSRTETFATPSRVTIRSSTLSQTPSFSGTTGRSSPPVKRACINTFCDCAEKIMRRTISMGNLFLTPNLVFLNPSLCSGPRTTFSDRGTPEPASPTPHSVLLTLFCSGPAFLSPVPLFCAFQSPSLLLV